MKNGLLAVLIAFSSFAQAEDLGRIGRTFPIVERDLIEVFKARAQARVDDGTWAKLMNGQTDKMKKYAARPHGLRLPRAMTYSIRYFDPTIELQNDIADATGKVLFKKGTRVNPFDTRNYTKTLCFFDGDDKAQVEWARTYCFEAEKAKPILTNGPVLDLIKTEKVMIYFDQYSTLVKHFGVKALPTTVRQTGKVMAVEEYEVGL